VTVTPRNRKGQAGTSVTVTFTVVKTDATEPVVVSFKALSPTTVNVTKGPVNITFELKVFDESSGFNSGLIAYPFTDPYIDDFFYPIGRAVKLRTVGSVVSTMELMIVMLLGNPKLAKHCVS
jgi:hypothetical protein